MEAYLDWQKKSGGIKLNDVIEEYRYVANGKSVKKGDFLTYVGEDVAPAIEPPFNAVALSSGVGGPEFVEIEETKTDNIISTTWTKINVNEYNGENGDKLKFISDSAGIAITTTLASQQLNKMCDGDDTTYARITGQKDSSTGNTTGSFYVEYHPGKPIAISKIRVKSAWTTANSSVNSSAFEGSNDGVVWQKLCDLSHISNGLTTVNTNNSTVWDIYRFNVNVTLPTSSSATRSFDCYEFRTAEYIVKEQIPSTEHNEQVKIARVYKEVEVEKTKTGNLFNKTWNYVSDTKYVADDGMVLSASSSYSEQYTLNAACDSNESTKSYSANEQEPWIMITLPNPIKITKMKVMFQPRHDANFINAVIQASKNGSDWNDLCTISSRQDTLTEFSLSNTDFYKYYKFKENLTSSTGLLMYEWQTSEYIEKVTEVIQ